MATVFEKTWYFDINRALSDNTTLLGISQSFVWWLKEFLKGNMVDPVSGLAPAAGKWTVFGSCDSVTAGLDNTDRWGTTYNASKIVRAAAGSAHSWIVLKSPIFATPAGNMTFYCTIDFSGNADSASVNLSFSKAAPTGGSTTARPTATDEWVHAANGTTSDGTTGTMHFNGHLAADGSWLVTMAKQTSGVAGGTMLFQVLAEARTADLYPAISFFGWSTAVTGALTCGTATTNITHPSSNWMRQRTFDGSAISTASCLMPYYDLTSTTLTTVQGAIGVDPADGAVADLPCYIYNSETGHRSIRGRLMDIRFACNSGVAQGATEPLSGGVTSMLMGGLWLPANAAPQL